MPVDRQPSFSAGELAPSLWGRSDLPRFRAGARRLYNFFVGKQGAAITRPGTKYCGTTNGTRADTYDFGGGGGAITYHPSHTYLVSGSKVRLIEFYFSDTDSTQNYVLELGEKAIRLWHGGALVTSNDSPVVVVTPYHQEHLHKISFAQSGDTVFMACAGYQPAKLTRNSDSTWTYEVLDFGRPAILPASGQTVDFKIDVSTIGLSDSTHPTQPWGWVVTELRKDSRGMTYESAPLRAKAFSWAGLKWSKFVTYPAGFIIEKDTDVAIGLYGYVSKINGNKNIKPPVEIGGQTFTSNTGWSPIQDYLLFSNYASGAAVKYNGNFYVSLVAGNIGLPPDTHPSQWSLFDFNAWVEDDLADLDIDVPITSDMPVGLWVGGVPSNPTSDPNFIAYRIYRGRAKIYGHVADITDAVFQDVGSIPDTDQSPPQGLNPFVVKKSDGTTDHTETPIAVTFFEDRLTFVGTDLYRPNFLFASKVGDYGNFDQRLYQGQAPDESLMFGLASRKREVARSAVGLDKLVVLTDAAVWSVGGAQGPIGPSEVEAHVHVDIGADWPRPLVIEGAVLWVRNKGTGVRIAAFDSQRASIVSKDLSMASEHLVLGHKIVDWCYQEDPSGVVWAVRDDGVLLSLTYAPETDTWAWAQHKVAGPTGQERGVVLSVCCIPEGAEDVVYLAVQGAAIAAWSSAVTYATGDVVTYSGTNYVSLQDGNTAFIPTVPSWNSGTGYSAGNVIAYNGTQYVSLQGSNINHTPDVSPTYWSSLQSLAYPAWSNSSTYAKGDTISYSGRNYVSLQDANTNNNPASAGTYWVRVTKYWDTTNDTSGPCWIMRMSSRQLQSATSDQVCVDAFWGVGVFGDGPDTFTNVATLSRFNGKQVWVHYDNGEAFGPFTCASGSVGPVPRTKPATGAFIGFPYTCELELLDLAEGRTRQKVVTDVALEVAVDQTMSGQTGGLKVGADFDHLGNMKVDATSELVRVPVLGAWNKGGRAAVRVVAPLPLTIRGVSREVERGEG